MPHKWQMRMAGALPVGTESSVCSWCFVKLGSSVEIARPVGVSEKGDSRVSRKWERLALRGSMVVLFAVVLVGGVQKGAVQRSQRALSACALSGSGGGLALSWTENQPFDARAFERLKSMSQHFNASS